MFDTSKYGFSMPAEDLEKLADAIREEGWTRDTQERARRIQASRSDEARVATIRASREKEAEENGW